MDSGLGSFEFSVRLNATMMEALDIKTPNMPFIYTPLQGKEIRLLVLMVQGWTNDEGDDDINCILVNVEPHLIPSYECLSYAWGTPSDQPSRVWCNRRSFPVSTGLLSALKCLRTGSLGPRFLWIDQLCINQKDSTEKGKQVQRMAEIYQNAIHVLLFPGLHSSFRPGVQFIFDFLGRFARAYSEKSGSFRQSWLRDSAEDLNYEYDIPLPEEEEWAVVRCLLSSPVFRRTWIVQEIILAREVRIMIDMEEYPFEDGSVAFATFLGMLNERSLSPVPGQYLENEADDVRTLLRDRLVYLKQSRSSAQALLPLLCEIRTFGATDPRDKVYGVLSMANDVKLLGILPDYGASTLACYTDTARKLIMRSQRLDVLLCKETLRKMAGLPTWVPDWSSHMLEKFGNYIDQDEKMYNATKGLKLALRDVGAISKLGVQGIYIDTIRSITTGVVDDQLTGMMEDLFGHGLWWMRAYSFIGPHYAHTNETLAQALGCTRLAGSHDENDKVSTQRFGLMDAKFHEVREDELREGGYPTDQENRDLVLMTAKVGTMSSYRVLFTTVEKFMGLAPLTAQIGDMIFLLPGSERPFVLRRVQDEEYELVGQCYTHGIMYGERADTELLQNITLL